MARKTVDFGRFGIDTLPNNLSVLCRIQSERGENQLRGHRKVRSRPKYGLLDGTEPMLTTVAAQA